MKGVSNYVKYKIRTCNSLHHCEICGQHIQAGERYHDGGYSRRAHTGCAEEFELTAANGVIRSEPVKDPHGNSVGAKETLREMGVLGDKELIAELRAELASVKRTKDDLVALLEDIRRSGGATRQVEMFSLSKGNHCIITHPSRIDEDDLEGLVQWLNLIIKKIRSAPQESKKP